MSIKNVLYLQKFWEPYFLLALSIRGGENGNLRVMYTNIDGYYHVCLKYEII